MLHVKDNAVEKKKMKMMMMEAVKERDLSTVMLHCGSASDCEPNFFSATN